MILRPVSPVSPIGPPITNRPVGLMWYFVSWSSSFAGITNWITFFRMSRRNSSLPTVSACWVEITTASTRTGLPFASYSTVTWLLPSGRRYDICPFLRTSLSRYVSLCANDIGVGISSSVSFVA